MENYSIKKVKPLFWNSFKSARVRVTIVVVVFGLILFRLLLSGSGHEIGDKFTLNHNVEGANSIEDFKNISKEVNDNFDSEQAKEDVEMYIHKIPKGDEVKLLNIKGDMCQIRDLDNELNPDVWTTCTSL